MHRDFFIYCFHNSSFDDNDNTIIRTWFFDALGEDVLTIYNVVAGWEQAPRATIGIL